MNLRNNQILEKIKMFHNHNQGLEIVVDKCEFREFENIDFYFINVIRQLYVLQIKGRFHLIIGNIILTKS